MQRREALNAVAITRRAIHAAVMLCLCNTCPAIGDETSQVVRPAQADGERAVAEKILQVGERLSLTGIAGYLNDKGNTPCLWFLGKDRSATEYELVGISQWNERLIGRHITIVGTVTNVPAARVELQMRAPRDAQETMLVEVRLMNGAMVEPENIDHANRDPFLAQPAESHPDKPPLPKSLKPPQSTNSTTR